MVIPVVAATGVEAAVAVEAAVVAAAMEAVAAVEVVVAAATTEAAAGRPTGAPAVAAMVVVVAAMVVGAVEGRATSLEIPCQDFSNNINIGCLCSLNEVNATRINCDNVVFPGDFPVLPYRYNSFTLLEKKGNVAGKPRY